MLAQALLTGTAVHGEDLHWSRDKCEEEEVAEGNCYELTTAPHSPSSCAAWYRKEEVEDLGINLSLGKRLQGVGLVFLFVSHHPTTLIGNKLVFPKSNLFCPWQQLSDLPVFILTHELFHLIFALCPTEGGGGSDRAAGWASGYPPRSTYYTTWTIFSTYKWNYFLPVPYFLVLRMIHNHFCSIEQGSKWNTSQTNYSSSRIFEPNVTSREINLKLHILSVSFQVCMNGHIINNHGKYL